MNALQSEETRILPVPDLGTYRLVLKAPSESDTSRLVDLAGNNKIAENLATLPHPYSEACAHDWIAGKSGSLAQGYDFCIHLNIPQPSLIGVVSFSAPDEIGQSTFGYWIGEPYWGRGYATEAALAALDYAFEVGGLNQMLGDCRITNVASRRVLEKCGFEFRGYGRSYCKALAEEVPVDCFALSRPRFRGLQIKRKSHNRLRPAS